METRYQLIIIGGGPAACTAAVYASRAGISTIMFTSTTNPGGELMNTTAVENFPGFPESIQGPELMERMLEQAEKYGTKVEYEDTTEVDLENKTVTAGDETYQAESIILATGSEYRKLGIPGEATYTGYGVSWCATCDGFFFKNKNLIVVGGGDSAMEEAIQLTQHATTVTLIHRTDQFKASPIMLERARANNKIRFREFATLVEITGENNQVTGAVLEDTRTGEQENISADGIFIAVGSEPRTHLVHHQLELTAAGTVATRPHSTVTSIPGVFAAGDVADSRYRQAITAAATGAMAALDAQEYLQG